MSWHARPCNVLAMIIYVPKYALMMHACDAGAVVQWYARVARLWSYGVLLYWHYRKTGYSLFALPSIHVFFRVWGQSPGPIALQRPKQFKVYSHQFVNTTSIHVLTVRGGVVVRKKKLHMVCSGISVSLRDVVLVACSIGWCSSVE
jgi:hypothetical protein